MKFLSIFWNNYKRQGYAQGKLMRNSFIKLVEKNDTDEIKNFLSSQIGVVLDNQVKQSNNSIMLLEQDIGDIKEEISSNTKKMLSETQLVVDKFEERKEDMHKDYTLCFNTNSDRLVEANRSIKEFHEDIVQYTKNIKETMREYVEKMFSHLEENQDNLTKLTKQEAKSILKDGLSVYINPKVKLDSKKDFWLLSILFLICVYDVILGFKVVKDVFTGSLHGIMLTIVSFALAIFFVGILLGLTHFIVKSIENPKTLFWRNAGILMMCIILLVLWLYVQQSSPNLTVREMFNSSVNPNLMEVIFRLLLIPALFGGELIIEQITWDNIFKYQNKAMKPLRFVKAIVAEKIYLIKEKSFQKEAQKQHSAIAELANKSLEAVENAYSYGKMIDTINNIQSLLEPIYKTHEEKVLNWKERIEQLEIEKQQEVNQVKEKYGVINSKLYAEVATKESAINLIKRQLGDVENSVGEGLKFGLSS